MEEELKAFLDQKVKAYNQPAFIAQDPISIPHQYQQLQDIEIAGFFAAIFAWGNRKTIIQKSQDLFQRMDHAPFAFITQHQEKDRKRLLDFKHRTFQDTDLFYFLDFLQHHYLHYPSLEDAFTRELGKNDHTIEGALNSFQDYFFSLPDFPQRTRKHIPAPAQDSTCKRLNMFLRWMVRKDVQGVDFGLWRQLNPAQLICPLDLHVGRVARKLGLLDRKQTDWAAALSLTDQLRKFDPDDPVKYDFALFGLGIFENY